MDDRQTKSGEVIGGGRHRDRQVSNGKIEMKPPNRGAGDGPASVKENRERYEQGEMGQLGINKNELYYLKGVYIENVHRVQT